MIDCVIPIRSGSLGIKNKNIKRINGVPLICNSIEIALKSKIFNRIIIAVDSIKYMKIISKYFVNLKKKKIILYKRTKKSSTGNAMTEVVLKEVINNFPKIKYIYFLQCTSPLLSYVDLKKSKKLFNKGFDSFFSGNIIKQFIWKKKNKMIKPINYKLSKRPIRQRHDGLIIENGSFYAFKTKGFLKYNSRLFGNIGCYISSQYRSLEVDEPRDLMFANILKGSNFFNEAK